MRLSGELSERMRIPGNMWMEIWSAARSVPARRQKRLFDETKEAEKVCSALSRASCYSTACGHHGLFV